MTAPVALALAMFCSPFALTVGEPPGERPPVQKPEASEPPGEAVEPAEAEPEPEPSFEPTPMEPVEPPVEPAFEPTPMEPDEPVPAPAPAPAAAPAPAPSARPLPPEAPAAGAGRRRQLIDAGYVPPQMSYGLIGGAAALAGLVITKQALSVVVCDEGRVNCGEAGILDRVMLGSVGVVAAMAGWAHGRRMAYDDAVTRREPRKVGARIGVGWGLFLAGVGLGAADLAMTVQCWEQTTGPYVIENVDTNPFKIRCRSGTSMLLADSATLLASLGAGLALSGHRYLGERSRYDAVLTRRVRVFPIQTNGGGGLGVAGRF